MSLGALILVAVLCVAGGLLLWGRSYTHDQVSSQLAAQKIFFPPADSPAIAAPEFAPMHQYAGQQLTTGPQAKVYADSFIANHLKATGGGQTYSQLSTQLQQDPNNAQLAKTVQTMFQGETLRGLLLSSYAFWTLGSIAGVGRPRRIHRRRSAADPGRVRHHPQSKSVGGRGASGANRAGARNKVGRQPDPAVMPFFDSVTAMERGDGVEVPTARTSVFPGWQRYYDTALVLDLRPHLQRVR